MTTATPKLLSAACPNCHSTRLASNDTVPATAEITAFHLSAKGVVQATYAGGSEACWDAQDAADPARPYICLDCDAKLRQRDILPQLAGEDALTEAVRERMITELVADFIASTPPTMLLENIAEEGFTPFKDRPDGELTEAYAAAFGTEALDQVLADNGADDDIEDAA